MMFRFLKRKKQWQSYLHLLNNNIAMLMNSKQNLVFLEVHHYLPYIVAMITK